MDLGAINRKVDFFLVNLGRKNFLEEEEEEEDHAIGDTGNCCPSFRGTRITLLSLFLHFFLSFLSLLRAFNLLLRSSCKFSLLAGQRDLRLKRHV